MNFSLRFFLDIFKKNEKSCLDKFLFWVLWGVVFLMPLFFITINSYPIEFNKTFLFIVLVLLLWLIYIIKSFKEKKFILCGTFIDWGILGFLFFNIVSFVFSQNKYISTVGISGFYSGGIISVFCFILFFYLLINVIKTWDDLKKIIQALQFSALIILIFNIFQVSKIYLLPWSETQNYSFNIIANSSLTLAIFSSLFVLISLVTYLVAEKKWVKYFNLFSLVISLVLLFLVNKDLPIYFLIGLIILILYLLSTKFKLAPNYWTVITTVVVTLLILFLIFDSGIIFNLQISENLVMDNTTASKIAWGSISDSPVWGSGQQTFLYDFSQYRPVEFNTKDIWNIQFLKSSNEWLGIISTVGLGAAIFLLFIYFKTIIKVGQNIFNNKNIDNKNLFQILIFFSWIFIFLSSIFIPYNFILYFLNWLLLGLVIVSINIEGNKYSEHIFWLKNINKKNWFVTLGLSALLILFVLVIYFGGRVWLADYKYASAQRAIVANEPEDKIFGFLNEAIILNPYESKYYLTLAQGYSAQALIETENYEINSPEIQALAQKVIDNLKLAKDRDPKNSLIYAREADIYDSLRTIIGNVDELSIEAYQTAISLEPNNPLLWLNLGRSRLLLAQDIFVNNDNEESKTEANNLLDLSIVSFEKARELKSDLAIDYNIGLVYQTKGDLDKALEYFNKELAIHSDSVNLYYQIALVYEQKGEIELAIRQLNKILELDPGNQEIIDVINKLEKSISEEIVTSGE